MNPSNLPSMDPSKLPSKDQSKLPSMDPSMLPSMDPSKLPSMLPSKDPSKLPSMNPSKLPSMDPSKLPSSSLCKNKNIQSVLFNGCLYYLNEELMNWQDHENFADTCNYGHLTSVTSSVEDQFVANFAGDQHVWIGGQRSSSCVNDFLWSD